MGVAFFVHVSNSAGHSFDVLAFWYGTQYELPELTINNSNRAEISWKRAVNVRRED